jgi:3-oxoacyl-[acyl-carrier-protein] synthase-3
MTLTAATTPSGIQFRPSRRWASLSNVCIEGVGSYVPENVVTNEELEQNYGFEPGWIKQRTGILERRYASPSQATSDLAAEAGRRACRMAGIEMEEIDLLVVGTFTPDFASCPSTACVVQEALGLDAPAFDIGAACSGFVYALTTAAQFIATGNATKALVIGADVNSRIVNPTDQKVAPLFGDGAGAVVLSHGTKKQGFMSYQLGSDGRGGASLDRPAGGTRNPLSKADLAAGRQFMHMDGRTVFKWAVQAVTESIRYMIECSGLSIEDISLFALHQANIRIINKAMDQLGVPREKVINNLSRYGNTSAASIPLVLDEAIQEGRIHDGDAILMSGFGAGLTWGTGVWRW